MAASPNASSTFTVNSGCLTYGALHNMYHGASVPARTFNATTASAPNIHGSNTVLIQSLDHNIPAINGTWKAYKLIDTRRDADKAVAWFVAHADVEDPQDECRKILRVAGSPYESGTGGNKWNDNDTAAAGVLVINRYDWEYYDSRGKKHVDDNPIGDKEYEDEQYDVLCYGTCLGLSDYATTNANIGVWRDKHPSRRDGTSSGVWLRVPDGEYMFGRFGFDDAHREARSFLYFTAYTEFRWTAFEGVEETLTRRVDDQV